MSRSDLGTKGTTILSTSPVRLRVAASLFRVWATFSIIAFAAALAAAFADSDHLLHSDDPYCAGFLVGTCCVLFSVMSGMANVIGLSMKGQTWAYWAGLVVMTALGAVIGIMAAKEYGGELGYMIGGGILVFGTIAYPIQRLRPSWRLLALSSLPGLLFLAGYRYVCWAWPHS